MAHLLIFGKEGCEACKRVFHKMEYFKNNYLPELEILYYDMETVDGLAEGAYRDVSDVPTVILEKDGKELERWKKIPPTYKRLREILGLREKK